MAPATVVGRAREILASLEVGAASTGGAPRAAVPGDAGGPQLGLFAPVASAHATQEVIAEGRPEIAEVVEALRGLDPDGLTPRQALDLLCELKKKLT